MIKWGEELLAIICTAAVIVVALLWFWLREFKGWPANGNNSNGKQYALTNTAWQVVREQVRDVVKATHDCVENGFHGAAGAQLLESIHDLCILCDVDDNGLIKRG